MATFAVEYAKSGRSTCKGTKELIPKGALRLAKVTEREHGDKTISMAAWYLPVPFFQMMKRMRKGSNIVESTADLAGFDELKDDDKGAVEKMISDYHDEEVDWPPKPAPKPKKKKEPSSDGDATQPSPKKAKKTIEIRREARGRRDGSVAGHRRRTIGATAGHGLQRPDADSARQQCGPVCRECLVDGVLDVGAVLRGMAAKWGMKETIECVVAENAPLAGVFKELSSFEYKKGDNIKGTAYKKVSAALAAHTEKITSGKEAKKLAGIGKSSADKIDEFLSSGKVAKLRAYMRPFAVLISVISPLTKSRSFLTLTPTALAGRASTSSSHARGGGAVEKKTRRSCSIPTTSDALAEDARARSVPFPRASSRLADIVERGGGVLVERARVIPPQIERHIMTLAENASRHGHFFAQQRLGFLVAP